MRLLVETPSTFFAAKLLRDVRYYADSEADRDAILLASALSAVGYCVVVRSALGGGSACFRNLRHDFISVRGSGDAAGQELIVEPRFREHFTITQPTPEFEALLAAAPDVFVGPRARLVPIVEALCDGMASSFGVRGLSLPPWRRTASMLSKWLPARARDTGVFRQASAPDPGPACAQPHGSSAPGTEAGQDPGPFLGLGLGSGLGLGFDSGFGMRVDLDARMHGPAPGARPGPVDPPAAAAGGGGPSPFARLSEPVLPCPSNAIAAAAGTPSSGRLQRCASQRMPTYGFSESAVAVTRTDSRASPPPASPAPAGPHGHPAAPPSPVPAPVADDFGWGFVPFGGRIGVCGPGSIRDSDEDSFGQSPPAPPALPPLPVVMEGEASEPAAAGYGVDTGAGAVTPAACGSGACGRSAPRRTPSSLLAAQLTGRGGAAAREPVVSCRPPTHWEAPVIHRVRLYPSTAAGASPGLGPEGQRREPAPGQGAPVK
ncbi:hypothetical protein HYH03_016876 [Edaphochlamys debaryana]|uniref:Uncharacterized protein n=1 Tax=Edaphochlamys debaryana TaxID=47281 RepID=A0A835XJ15_9CHLO|nr:hypothetical protein HYH03_016876 [Edaphochlamys debaryana]|eukprot:KAG2484334.1 hypothetical protein HYH03_016876 [Edaphochlamys debaryana]